jgi:hypothetical protein
MMASRVSPQRVNEALSMMVEMAEASGVGSIGEGHGASPFRSADFTK